MILQYNAKIVFSIHIIIVEEPVVPYCNISFTYLSDLFIKYINHHITLN